MSENRTLQPHVSARVLLVRDDALLLVNGDGAGDFWVTPGGQVEFGESAEQCAVREAREETGLDVAVRGLWAVSEFLDEVSGFHNIDLFFRAEIIGGALDDCWIDRGGPVATRRFFTVEDIRAAGTVFPVFLGEGGWLSTTAGPGPVYRGMERKVRL